MDISIIITIEFAKNVKMGVQNVHNLMNAKNVKQAMINLI